MNKKLRMENKTTQKSFLIKKFDKSFDDSFLFLLECCLNTFLLKGLNWDLYWPMNAFKMIKI